LIGRKPDHFEGRKLFRRVRGRIAERRQLGRSHQNLQVTLREAVIAGNFFTGSSKLATARRETPKTSKNSFQKVCFSALSLFAPVQSRENRIALWRISFQEIGMGSFYTKNGGGGNEELNKLQ
jgi:hypothetical protein